MDLRKLMATVIGSSREDWHHISGTPTFHDDLRFYDVYDGHPAVLHCDAHHSVATFIPNASISLGWGLKWNEDFQADWCKNFPDPKANGGYVDVFFNNALVYRACYVWV